MAKKTIITMMLALVAIAGQAQQTVIVKDSIINVRVPFDRSENPDLIVQIIRMPCTARNRLAAVNCVSV